MSTSGSPASIRVWASIVGPPATLCARLRYDGAHPPHELIAALEARGFVANGRIGPRNPLAATDVVEEFARPGTGPFGAWTPAEAEQGRRELLAVCEASGLPFNAPEAAPSQDAR